MDQCDLLLRGDMAAARWPSAGEANHQQKPTPTDGRVPDVLIGVAARGVPVFTIPPIFIFNQPGHRWISMLHAESCQTLTCSPFAGGAEMWGREDKEKSCERANHHRSAIELKRGNVSPARLLGLFPCDCCLSNELENGKAACRRVASLGCNNIMKNE
ncbi:unnamed protein product [Pleuronectes platessa]|uniref:Uncharacterized protein n=1 Tax=Pleuronectes platessa TaxID=8262 RepID=A0A9N7TUY7_PLEPL|nr:unnamed protein product [Pleuronectes platessa]